MDVTITTKQNTLAEAIRAKLAALTIDGDDAFESATIESSQASFEQKRVTGGPVAGVVIGSTEEIPQTDNQVGIVASFDVWLATKGDTTYTPDQHCQRLKDAVINGLLGSWPSGTRDIADGESLRRAVDIGPIDIDTTDEAWAVAFLPVTCAYVIASDPSH